MERKVGEGCLLVWGRLLKRRCLSEQRPSTISLLHLFVSWANLSSVVQACPQEILNLYILSAGYFEGGGGLFSVCPGDSNSRLSSYQYLDVPSRLGQSILTSFDRFVSEWVPYQIFPMGTRLLLCLSVLLSDFFSCTNWKMWMKLYRNECVRSTWMNDWMIDQSHEWTKKGRMEGTRVRRTADVTLLISII